MVWPLGFWSTVVLILVVLTILANRKHANAPPSPFRLPILGNLLSMGPDPLVALPKLVAKYGGLISLQVGWQRMVLLGDHEAVLQVFKRHGTKTSDRPNATRYWA